MAKAKRVFQVAKQLGVSSKAIVEKCTAEGVPDITNHMSTVKVGLEATIHEWFGDVANLAQTAVETTGKVDMAKARKGVRRRASAKNTAVAEAEAPDKANQESVSKAPPQSADAAAVVVSAPAAVEPPSTDDSNSVTTASPATETTTPDADQPAIPDESVPQTVTPAGQLNVPVRPVEVKPAGSQLEKPKEAVLRGPKVVRVEQADELKPPPTTRSPVEPPAVPGKVDGIERSRGPLRGKGAVDGVDAPGQQAKENQQAKGGKRRSLTTRRGRSTDAQLTGPGNFSEQDLLELDARLRGAPGFLKQRRRDLKKRQDMPQAGPMPVEIGGTVEIAEPITIKGLSSATGIKSTDIVKYLFQKGVMATINSTIDTEAAMEVALEHEIELQVREQQTAEQQVLEEFEKREQIDVRLRPPVVAVLGHVDHGKTSLLDKIRKANVAEHEDGGITQHVGAYRATVVGHDGQEKTVVFLDTPGHEAFTSMRARGAHMTDLVVLVVAADDGVMPQTIESVNHAKAAGVSIVVALNKVDRPEATEGNIQKIYGQLAEHELNPVEWGGNTEIVKTSAETGDGITELIEHLDYQAELLDLKADFEGPARGTVIEAEMQEGRGPVARVLVQQGLISVGDFVVIGRSFGRVRDMSDDRGRSIRQAGPATPLELSGIDKVPDAGDKFFITDTLRKAEEVAKQYRHAERQRQLANKTKVTLDTFAETLNAGKIKELRVVLKADVQGSLDVLTKSMSGLGNDEVAVRVIHSAVGGISESDVLLAEASDAIIVGFHVVASSHARDLAEHQGVDIRLYRVIYDVTDELRNGLEGMLSPETKEQVSGEAEVREVFRISKLGNIAGCLITEGAVHRQHKIRVTRDDVVITEGRDIETLRRVKDDASEVRAGTECGIRIGGFDDVKVGDKLICYSVETIIRKLDQ